MPIVLRRGHVNVEPRARLLRFDRPTLASLAAAPIGIEAASPLVLRDELARLALDLAVRTSEPVDLPRRWRSVPFAFEVDHTRAQLRPIQSRSSLLASFGREASVAVTRSAGRTERCPADATVTDPAPGPVRVAYALRWLELGDGRIRPAWASIVAGPVELVAGSLGALGLDVGQGQRRGEIIT